GVCRSARDVTGFGGLGEPCLSTRTAGRLGPAVFGDRWSTLHFGRPRSYAPRRGPIVDATAHERRLRGDGFGDGFGGGFSLVGRSTGGTSGPVLTSTGLFEVGSPRSPRLRVAGSSPASGVSNQRPLDHMCWSLVSREPRLTRVVWCTFRSIRPGLAVPKFSA